MLGYLIPPRIKCLGVFLDKEDTGALLEPSARNKEEGESELKKLCEKYGAPYSAQVEIILWNRIGPGVKLAEFVEYVEPGGIVPI